ncbi:ATP-binding protein [Peptostreptococcus faecalis]|uniref:ATP-binding protein n=1 Tax=Peptostreptococcus faecalis TaxID=2045015 RepID=UPI000C7C1711|nr:ATP-binding protein [Peptostreptococcus faecalis]
MNKEKIRAIMLEYQKKRDRNQDILENRISEVYTNFPEIEEVSTQIKKLGLKMTKSIIEGIDEEKINSYEAEYKSLIEKKKKLFDLFNIEDDYLELKYDCNTCKDTGFLENGQKCNCLKQRILNDSYKMSNLDKILHEDNFDKFDFDIFSDEITPGYDISPRDNIKSIFMDVQDFVYNFDKNIDSQKGNLLFTGSTGLGKTFLSSCIAKEIMNLGYTVIYQTAFNLMEVIEKYKFKTESFSSIDEENYNNLFSADLLIIDDLGTEMVNSFTSSELFNILNSRLNSKKKIIISTNLDVAQIGKIYTDRTLSRIVGHFQIYEFFGTDLRFR